MVMNINGGGYLPQDKSSTNPAKAVEQASTHKSPAHSTPDSSHLAASSPANHTDTVKLTTLPESRSSSPPIDHERVAALSKAIAEGSYSVDSEQLANDISALESSLFGKQG